MYHVTLSYNQKTHLSEALSDFLLMYCPNFDFLIKGKRRRKRSFETLVVIHEVLKNNHCLLEFPRQAVTALHEKTSLPFEVSAQFHVELTYQDLTIISKVTELHARLEMDQFDMLMNVYNHDDEQLLKEYLTGKIVITKEQAALSWDLYQVVRHHLAWERAGNPSQRDFSSMMAVDYDRPAKRSVEPLMVIKTIQMLGDVVNQ